MANASHLPSCLIFVAQTGHFTRILVIKGNFNITFFHLRSDRIENNTQYWKFGTLTKEYSPLGIWCQRE